MRCAARALASGAGLWAAAVIGAAPPAAARAAITVTTGGGFARSPVVVVVEEDTNRVSVFAARADKAVLLARFGGKGSEPGRFSRPYGAVVHDGAIWVTDRLNSRVQAFDMAGRHLRTVGLAAPAGGRAPEPGAPAVGRDGHLIIPDLANDQLMVLRTDGRLIARWGRPGRGAGEFMQPVAVAVSPVDGRIFTVEAFEPRIQVFDPAGRWLAALTGAGRLVKPTKAAVDGANRLYVADEALNQILRFTTAGQVDLSWGGYGTEPGALFLPEGLAVDDQQRLWVVDHGNHRGQVFTAGGKQLFSFASGEIGVVPGALPVRPSSADRGAFPWPPASRPAFLAALILVAVAVYARSFRSGAT